VDIAYSKIPLLILNLLGHADIRDSANFDICPIGAICVPN
jgi:hypothetical protein